jgi:hypothetical protein
MTIKVTNPIWLMGTHFHPDLPIAHDEQVEQRDHAGCKIIEILQQITERS